MTKAHHPHNRLERMKARRKKEISKLDEKTHKEERASKVWRKLSAESLKEWEIRNELDKVARGYDPT